MEEKSTRELNKTDVYAQRMPSHRGQRPVERERLHTAETPVTEPEKAGKAELPAAELPGLDLMFSQRRAAGSEPGKVAEAAEKTASPARYPAEAERGAGEEKQGPPVRKTPGKKRSGKPKKPVKKKPAKTKPTGRPSSASWFKRHKPSAVLLLTVFLLLVVVAALALKAGKTAYGNTGNYMDQIRNQKIKLNDVAAIDHFFSAYYTAMASGNTTELERMFDDPSKVQITTEISTIVNQYDNFQVYVTPGIQEHDMVAFVSNDIHFANIDATAPSVDSFYLTYDPEEAALKIRADMYTDQEILKFMNLVSYREPVRSLLSDTNSRLSEALAGNKDLNNLYVLMQSMKEAADYSAETETETQAETATTEG